MTTQDLLGRIEKTRKSGFSYMHRMEQNKKLAYFIINVSCFISIVLTYFSNCGTLPTLENSRVTHYSFIVSLVSFIFSLIIASVNYQSKIDETRECNRNLNKLRDQVASSQAADLQPFINRYHDEISATNCHHEGVDFDYTYHNNVTNWLRFHFVSIFFLSLLAICSLFLIESSIIFNASLSSSNKKTSQTTTEVMHTGSNEHIAKPEL